jgi:hypothetical protein
MYQPFQADDNDEDESKNHRAACVCVVWACEGAALEFGGIRAGGGESVGGEGARCCCCCCCCSNQHGLSLMRCEYTYIPFKSARPQPKTRTAGGTCGCSSCRALCKSSDATMNVGAGATPQPPVRRDSKPLELRTVQAQAKGGSSCCLVSGWSLS